MKNRTFPTTSMNNWSLVAVKFGAKRHTAIKFGRTNEAQRS